MPPAKTARPSLEEARKATAEAAAETSRVLTDLGRKAQGAVKERLDGLSGPAKDYTDDAGERLETAQQYVVDRINEKPVPAALTALAIGLALCFLLAGRSR